MKIDPARRDAWIWGAVVIGAGLLGRSLAQALTLPDGLQTPFAVACALLASVVVKLLMPNHTVLRVIPWLYFAIVMPIVFGVAVLLSNWSWLGLMTLPAVGGLVLLLGLLHLVMVAREDDGPTENR